MHTQAGPTNDQINPDPHMGMTAFIYNKFMIIMMHWQEGEYFLGQLPVYGVLTR